MDWGYFTAAGIPLLTNSPIIAAWIIGIIIAARMFRRGGGPAERLLLIGCCLMLGEKIFSSFKSVLHLWYYAEHEVSASEMGTFSMYTAIPLSLLMLAGIVCLVVAFWKRWQSYGPTPSKQKQAVLGQDTSGT